MRSGFKTIEVTATGVEIATARKLNEFLLSCAKINWEGDTKATTALTSVITGDKTAPEVKQLKVTGYQPETGAYIYSKWAVNMMGKLVFPDKRGLFQIGHNQYFRPPAHSDDKDIPPTPITKERVQEIQSLIYAAWGMNGLAALSWIVAGWFVCQIKNSINFFPFLSLHGEVSTGKSSLTLLLNSIQGREGEGLPVTQLNSKKGLTRTIGQLSGLFTALLEDNDRNVKAFDWSIVLTAYNKGPLQVQAAFSNDLQTREAPFLGSLLFSQNSEPFNSKAEKQRTISLDFKSDQLDEKSRIAFEKLMATPKNELAGVIQQVLIKRSHFEAWHKEYETAINDLGPMAERRILQNYALILGFYRLFCSCFNIMEDAKFMPFIAEIGRQKCISSAIRQTTIADHFFELLDTIDADKSAYAYHIDKEQDRILVNLPRAENLIRNKGVSFQANEQLHQALQKHPAYLRNSLQYRFPNEHETDNAGRPKQRKVWVFSLEWFQKNNGQHFDEGASDDR